MKSHRVEISLKTILYVLVIALGAILAWYLRDIIILLVICFIFMEALNPTINHLQKYKISRILAIILVYFFILALVAVVVAGVLPALVEQTASLAAALPDIIRNTSLFGASAADISNQFKILESLPGDIAKAIVSVFSNIFSLFLTMVITFYLLLERENFDDYTAKYFGEKNKAKVKKILVDLESRLGSWVNAEIILMVIIGVMSYVGYLILGLNFALPLAIIAGFLEIVPNIGPIVSTALSAIVGLTISPLTALLAIVWGIIVQQTENNFIVPKVMKTQIGLNPLATIFLLATGAKLGGVMGAILAVPIYLTIDVIFKVLRDKQ
ncbi:MAG: AI-2E family transporter [Candidatus Shapirobacteria bacterium]|jgi:predicted PurR-regulated permease PerM